MVNTPNTNHYSHKHPASAKVSSVNILEQHQMEQALNATARLLGKLKYVLLAGMSLATYAIIPLTALLNKEYASEPKDDKIVESTIANVLTFGAGVLMFFASSKLTLDSYRLMSSLQEFALHYAHQAERLIRESLEKSPEDECCEPEQDPTPRTHINAEYADRHMHDPAQQAAYTY